jgi:hypothetical protein
MLNKTAEKTSDLPQISFAVDQNRYVSVSVATTSLPAERPLLAFRLHLVYLAD